MNGLSPWALTACSELTNAGASLFNLTIGSFSFHIHTISDSIWVLADTMDGGRMAFRVAYSPGIALQLDNVETTGQKLTIRSSGDLGHFLCEISIDQGAHVLLRYKTTLTPKKDLFIPFWPRDLLIIEKTTGSEKSRGKIHAGQWGTRSGFIFGSLRRSESCSFLYLQNLTALSHYCEQTQTTVADSVGGTWPELGFALPPSLKKPIKAGIGVLISDAIVGFSETVPKDEPEMVKLYLQLLGRLYLELPRPETNYQHWPEVLDKGLRDLIDSPGCWTQVAGHQYFNAYVSDYETPPEIMVQLAILLPLLDYVEWSGDELKVMKTIKEGLPAFYDEKLKTINRWLPAAEDKLKGEEEQKEPGVMDSWYLHHPLLNLSRLALKGDSVAKQLFLDSLDYAIKVAHHFNYKWPVFYKMDTLEVLKAETAEGMGGEKDVPGIYAHIMLQAWELTGTKRFLTEAERAAKTLSGLGFELFYQANNTAFSAGAMLRLYKITGKELYLNLSYTCLAGIFRNTQLWDCNYGFGKNFPRFFALYPLNDAPYTAAYEEQEVFCALHDYLAHAEGLVILPEVRMLIAEYIRYLVDRAVFYYPAMLPADMLEQKPKIGEVDAKLWIALEDLQDGWLKSGSVGQEVYGAGNAFGILPRHYLRVPGEEFMVYIDYPTTGFHSGRGQNIHFHVLGDDRLNCRMMIVKTGKAKLPEFELRLAGSQIIHKGTSVAGGNLEYIISGNQKVQINWKKPTKNKTKHEA